MCNVRISFNLSNRKVENEEQAIYRRTYYWDRARVARNRVAHGLGLGNEPLKIAMYAFG